MKHLMPVNQQHSSVIQEEKEDTKLPALKRTSSEVSSQKMKSSLMQQSHIDETMPEVENESVIKRNRLVLEQVMVSTH